ncbi:hypothetical protein [Paracoccus benzoatiresistens]|uniref:Transposase n=1 Tax=Paracoccus benzoatiresistens TaxID=2997341 RepID=A0ABT4JBK7_9RHOB|nr:hypothetical protein [Paracoccus sp. EF6]MCZ0963713.1 hypothetical protein [Paracoccus sp. EF6]
MLLPAAEDDGLCFAPIMLSDGGALVPEPALSGQPVKSDTASSGPIEIAVGQVMIRLNGATSAAKIAEIVRAIGPSP